MKRIQFAIVVAFAVCLTLLQSCGSTQTMALNSVQLTNQLQPGMSYDEVVQILGNPKSSQMAGDEWICRWNLQEMWVGYKPYDMIFDPKTRTLISWSENEEDFQKKQEQLKELNTALEQSTATSGGSGGSGGGSGNASATGPNDPQLMQQFAGTYYSFSAVGGGQTGGTETSVTLCPDGTYIQSSETGYSGSGWGSASQGGNRGTWRIVGNMNQGTLTTVSSSGSATEYKFSRCGNDCVYFGNNKFAYAGPPNCR